MILKREVEEHNTQVKIIQAGRTNKKGDYFKLSSNKSGMENSDRNLIDIGLGSDTAIKNYNPNLEVKGGEG